MCRFEKIGFTGIGLIACLSLIALPSYAAFFDLGGANPRVLAVGDALETIPSYDGFWSNPAILSGLPNLPLAKSSIGISYSKILPGLDEDNLHRSLVSSVLRFGDSKGIGFKAHMFNSEFCSEIIGALGYGMRLGSKFQLGLAAKMLRWSTDGDSDPISGVKDKDRSATSVSIDVGSVIYLGRLGPGDLLAGFLAQDVNGPNISESGADDGKLPLTLNGGLRYLIGQISFGGSWLYKDGMSKIYSGIEYPIRVGNADFALRGGGSADSSFEETGLGLGFGYSRPGSLTINYAYTYSNNMPAEFLQGSHHLSFSFLFGK